MRTELLINAIGCIDSAIVDESENYKPARKKHIMIGAAAAACLCLAVVFGLSRPGTLNTENCLRGIIMAQPVHGYVDYRERAETGKVLITDELQALMKEYKDEKPLIGAWDCCSYVFEVRVVDANGASASDIYYTCIQPLGLRADDTAAFFTEQLVNLTSDEIKSIKGDPRFALIISPAALVIDEEYLKTVEPDTLDVYVILDTGEETPGLWYEDEKGVHCFDEQKWEEFEAPRITKFFNEYADDYGIDRESLKDYRENTGTFRAELSTELIARLFADERTRFIYMVVDYR